ncbi:MAG: hypothetical protein NQU41_01040 [Candidatus Methanosuratincola sp.]|uniref:Uncharacterized protein n=1 Tax=Candidatus Methanosuratincola petrocarbonis (ex Vanwonterghem et al. 2016) TaxID=1867261 RepID=A0A7J3V0G6_9CREN|nr:hypothetical protein [Candidatus Methanosuratincola sp.]
MSLLKEEGEDIGMKVIQLEEKTNKLEGAVAEISKETRAVLSDVRVVLTELENPMNYLKGLGIDEVMLTMAENITENKLKEFMEKRLESLVRTVVEGKLKETVNNLIAEFMEKEAGSIIEGKVREMKEKGILKVPIDVEELRKALDSKLSEALESGALDSLVGRVKGELLESLKGEMGSKLAKDRQTLDSLKAALKQEILAEMAAQGQCAARAPEETQVANAAAQPAQQQQREAQKRPISIVGTTACAAVLVRIFGRRGAERVVDDNYRLGRINEDARSSLMRAISIMCASDPVDVPYERECTVEEHLLVTYMFERLGNGGSDLDFMVLTNLLGNSSPAKGRGGIKD